MDTTETRITSYKINNVHLARYLFLRKKGAKT